MGKKKYEKIAVIISQLEIQDMITTSNEMFDKIGFDAENWDE